LAGNTTRRRQQHGFRNGTAPDVSSDRRPENAARGRVGTVGLLEDATAELVEVARNHFLEADVRDFEIHGRSTTTLEATARPLPYPDALAATTDRPRVEAVAISTNEA